MAIPAGFWGASWNLDSFCSLCAKDKFAIHMTVICDPPNISARATVSTNGQGWNDFCLAFVLPKRGLVGSNIWIAERANRIAQANVHVFVPRVFLFVFGGQDRILLNFAISGFIFRQAQRCHVSCTV